MEFDRIEKIPRFKERSNEIVNLTIFCRSFWRSHYLDIKNVHSIDLLTTKNSIKLLEMRKT